MSALLPLAALTALFVFATPGASRALSSTNTTSKKPAKSERPTSRREAAKRVVDAAKRHAIKSEDDNLRALARDAVRKFEASDRAPSSPPQAAPKPSATVSPKPSAKPSPKAPSAPAQASPAKPAPKAPAGPSFPPGTDFGAARRTAPQVTAHLVQKGRDGYDRKLLSAWQKAAGIPADGIYGGGTAGALRHFTKSAPGPFFKPVTIAPYKWSSYAT